MGGYYYIYLVYFDDELEFVFEKLKHAQDYVDRCCLRSRYHIKREKIYFESI